MHWGSDIVQLVYGSSFRWVDGLWELGQDTYGEDLDRNGSYRMEQKEEYTTVGLCGIVRKTLCHQIVNYHRNTHCSNNNSYNSIGFYLLVCNFYLHSHYSLLDCLNLKNGRYVKIYW